MSIQKLCQDLQTLVGNPIQVITKSVVNVPVPIQIFDFMETDSYICFGELYSEQYMFEIPKSKIKEITQDLWLQEEFDGMCGMYQVCIKLENKEFVQYITILCEE